MWKKIILIGLTITFIVIFNGGCTIDNKNPQVTIQPLPSHPIHSINPEPELPAEDSEDWEILNDDISLWVRSGNPRTEIYIDENNQLILKNPDSASNPDRIATLATHEKWTDFTLIIEFKEFSGHLELTVRDKIVIPFPTRYSGDRWNKYVIKLKGSKLAINEISEAQFPRISEVPIGTGPIKITINMGDNIVIGELKIFEEESELKAKITPILKEMRNQNDEEYEEGVYKVIRKGKKAVPILIEAIGSEDA
jgi:hypothetical protein